jgi:hypothetical protein
VIHSETGTDGSGFVAHRNFSRRNSQCCLNRLVCVCLLSHIHDAGSTACNIQPWNTVINLNVYSDEVAMSPIRLFWAGRLGVPRGG